jgi:hypothetical protein
VNQGTNLVLKKFNSALGVFVQQACPVYQSSTQANFGLDPSGGGQNIPAGATFAHVDAYSHSVLNLTAPLAHSLLVLQFMKDLHQVQP